MIYFNFWHESGKKYLSGKPNLYWYFFTFRKSFLQKTFGLFTLCSPSSSWATVESFHTMLSFIVLSNSGVFSHYALPLRLEQQWSLFTLCSSSSSWATVDSFHTMLSFIVLSNSGVLSHYALPLRLEQQWSLFTNALPLLLEQLESFHTMLSLFFLSNSGVLMESCFLPRPLPPSDTPPLRCMPLLSVRTADNSCGICSNGSVDPPGGLDPLAMVTGSGDISDKRPSRDMRLWKKKRKM